MKKRAFFILFSFVCLFCQSCQNEETEANETSKIDVPRVGLLLDGGQISDISLYCIEDNKSMIGELWYEYYAKTKTVSDYSSFKLCLMLNRNAGSYYPDDLNERAAIARLEAKYVKEKSLFIYERYENYIIERQEEIGWPDLFTAYTNGDLSITCDKILFGEQPGTNLSSYFTVSSKSPCVPIGIESPRILYDFGEQIPTDVSRLFMKGTWLQPEYDFRFAKQPAEKYEELTLYISLPLLKEHVRNMVIASYKGTEFGQKLTESECKAECLIKFNWE